MKNIVLLPCMRFPTPCVRRPKSLARDLIHVALSGPVESARYSRDAPVSLSMTALARASVLTMWVAAAMYRPCSEPCWLFVWCIRGVERNGEQGSDVSGGIRWGAESVGCGECIGEENGRVDCGGCGEGVVGGGRWCTRRRGTLGGCTVWGKGCGRTLGDDAAGVMAYWCRCRRVVDGGIVWARCCRR